MKELTYNNIENQLVGWAIREMIVVINQIRKNKNISIHNRPDLKIDFPLLDFIESYEQMNNSITFEMKMTLTCAISIQEYSSILLQECLLNSITLTDSIPNKEITSVDFSIGEKSASVLINFDLNSNVISA